MTYEELEEYLKYREQEERQAVVMWSTGRNQHLAAYKGGKRL
jgi:hypothetical protein